MGTALFAARHGERLAGRAAVGTTAPHWARKDPADRPQDHPGSSSRLHPLEHAKLGPSGGSECLLGKPDLAGAPVETASREDVQIEQRPAVCREVGRYCGIASAPASGLGGVAGGRTVSVDRAIFATRAVEL